MIVGLSFESVTRIWSGLVSVSVDWETIDLSIFWAQSFPNFVGTGYNNWVNNNYIVYMCILYVQNGYFLQDTYIFFFKSRKSFNQNNTQSLILNNMSIMYESKFNVHQYFLINYLIILPIWESIMFPKTHYAI